MIQQGLRSTVIHVALLLLCGGFVRAETIAIIGTGQVGSALGPEFAAMGHDIVYGSREPMREDVRSLVARTGDGARAMLPAEAVRGADIVVLAVPGMAVDDITRSLGDLDGKVIIDPTNALVSRDDGQFTMGVETSNAEIIQAAAPGAHVVKAFNTLNWRTMVEPETAGGPVTIPLVGNDAGAKAIVAGLVEGLGLEAIDLGPLENARYVEGMLILWFNNRTSGREPFEYHLRKRAAN
jgi:8-hydroxy-5-deazaflavin:NADPH oxidoreductase